jgi:hypothetical protein
MSVIHSPRKGCTVSRPPGVHISTRRNEQPDRIGVALVGSFNDDILSDPVCCSEIRSRVEQRPYDVVASLISRVEEGRANRARIVY